MEYAIQPTPFVSFTSNDDQKTQLIRRRPTLSAEYIVTGIKRHKFAAFGSLILLTFIGVGLSVYKYNGAPQLNSDAALLSVIDPSTTEEDLKISKLATSGKVLDIAISPDGKYVAYVTGEESITGERGVNSIRLRQMATSSDVEIVPPPSAGKLMNLSFSRDGNLLYYLLNKTIYRIAALSGSPTKITDNADGGSVSPDGNTIAFNRGTPDGTDQLVLANADGTNERILVKTQPDWVSPLYCGGVPAWSPDGKTIACWSQFMEKDANYWKISAISVADGSQQQLSDQKFRRISGAVYMPDGNLVVTGIEKSTASISPSQVWLVAPGSPAKRITNDLTGYSTVSATAKGDVLVTLQPRVMLDLWILPDNDVSRARQVTSSGEIQGGFSWMPDGKMVISSGAGGNADIWTMNVDGTGRKQLTANQGWNSRPRVSVDGRYIVFTSSRGSSLNVFRMDSDGSNVKKLTNDQGGFSPKISSDGKWVYYLTTDPINICKISIDGGQPAVLASAPGSGSGAFAVSPVDGRIAYEQFQTIQNRPVHKIFIISPNGGPPIKTIEMPSTFPPRGFFSWTPDGKGIAFTDTRNGGSNIWKIGLDGKPDAEPLINFATYQTFAFDWSPDGKQLAASRAISTSEAVLISRIK